MSTAGALCRTLLLSWGMNYDKKEVYVCVKIYFGFLIVKLCYTLLLEIRIPSLWPRTMTSILALHFSSVQFSRSVMSNSLWPHELQHTRPPCPSPTPGVHLNPYPLCQWWHPTISSSVVPFSPCPQSFPASGSFPTSQLFTSVGQSIGVSASTSVLPKILF